MSVVCPPVAWRCAEHFGRMWQCQHCRKVSQHRALGGLQSQNIRTEVDLFHQSINFRFSLQTLSHPKSSHLPLFKKDKWLYIYINMQACWHMLVVPLHPIPKDLSLNWHSLNSGIQAVLGRALRLPRLKGKKHHSMGAAFDLNRDSTWWHGMYPMGPYVFVHMYVH